MSGLGRVKTAVWIVLNIAMMIGGVGIALHPSNVVEMISDHPRIFAAVFGAAVFLSGAYEASNAVMDFLEAADPDPPAMK